MVDVVILVKREMDRVFAKQALILLLDVLHVYQDFLAQTVRNVLIVIFPMVTVRTV
jgi:hypothetical protein